MLSTGKFNQQWQIDNWECYAVSPPPDRIQRFVITDYLKQLLPTSLDCLIISGSNGLILEDIEKLVNYAKNKNKKLLLCDEFMPLYDLDQFENDLVWFTESPYQFNHKGTNKKWHVNGYSWWFRTIIEWKKFKKKFSYNENKKYSAVMRCGNITEKKTMIYAELESRKILDTFQWSCIFHAPWLKSKTPKYFDSEINFHGVDKEYPNIEQTQSFVQIVIESADTLCQLATEKTFQAMATHCPMFWWAPCDMPQSVTKYGFEYRFTDIDYGYLAEPDDDKRCKMLCDQVQKLTDITWAKHLYTVNREQTAYNFNRLWDMNECVKDLKPELQNKLNI